MPTKKKLIQAIAITVNRAEGLHSEVNKPVTVSGGDVWGKANAVLRGWSRTAPKGGGYDKCDFTVKFADGEKYNGRYDLMHFTKEVPDLTQHVYNFLRFNAGEWPSWMTEEKYREFLKGSRFVDSSKNFLTTYAIGIKNLSPKRSGKPPTTRLSSRKPRLTPKRPRLRR